jgi:hypothetical protein
LIDICPLIVRKQIYCTEEKIFGGVTWVIKLRFLIMVRLSLVEIFNYVILKAINIIKERKYSFAVVVIPITNRFVTDLIRKLDLRAALSFPRNAETISQFVRINLSKNALL